MDISPLSVAITGDTGNDIYTEYVPGYVSSDDRVRGAKAAWDIEVPSGAAYTKLAFDELLKTEQQSLRIEYILPKVVRDNPDASTLHRYLIQMDRYKSRANHAHLGESVLRVKDALPICDKFPEARSDVFYNLVRGGETKGTASSTPDLLVIHDGGGSWRE